MITRHVLEGTTFQDYALGYDAKNRLVKVCEDVNNPAVCDAGETVVAQFTYDADGKRVKSVMGADTILFPSTLPSVAGQAWARTMRSRTAVRSPSTIWLVPLVLQ